jgi:hypothetical protein
MKKLYLIILAFSLVSCLEQATEPKGESIILTDDLPAQFYDWEDFEIINYSPLTSLPDSIVTIYGKAFGVYRDSVEVFFGSYIAELISINDTVLKVKVPDIESERYQIKINIRDTSVTLNPDFNLVRSIYQYNHYEFYILNLYCERLQTNKNADTGVYSFSFKQPSWIINLSDKNTIRFLYPYYEPTYVSMILVPDSMFFKDIRYKGQYFGQSQRETIYNELTISKANLDHLSDTLLFAAIGHDELTNAVFHFYRKRVQESGYNKNKYTEYDVYNFLRLTDSTEVRIRLVRN